jgi:hypothetical protein
MVLGEAEVVDWGYNEWWPFKRDDVLFVSSHLIYDPCSRWPCSQAT